MHVLSILDADDGKIDNQITIGKTPIEEAINSTWTQSLGATHRQYTYSPEKVDEIKGVLYQALSSDRHGGRLLISREQFIVDLKEEILVHGLGLDEQDLGKIADTIIKDRADLQGFSLLSEVDSTAGTIGRSWTLGLTFMFYALGKDASMGESTSFANSFLITRSNNPSLRANLLPLVQDLFPNLTMEEQSELTQAIGGALDPYSKTILCPHNPSQFSVDPAQDESIFSQDKAPKISQGIVTKDGVALATMPGIDPEALNSLIASIDNAVLKLDIVISNSESLRLSAYNSQLRQLRTSLLGSKEALVDNLKSNLMVIRENAVSVLNKAELTRLDSLIRQVRNNLSALTIDNARNKAPIFVNNLMSALRAMPDLNSLASKAADKLLTATDAIRRARSAAVAARSSLVAAQGGMITATGTLVDRVARVPVIGRVVQWGSSNPKTAGAVVVGATALGLGLYFKDEIVDYFFE
ncbi:MAG: hypothetical protein KDK66_00380 [Deltaproteobacteria bacterium]|nr:hypothetical protein [Deltaproteobacteria bacterium]